MNEEPHWIEYPRVGTLVEDGWWMCTVVGSKHSVQILRLRGDTWYRRGGKKLGAGKRVVAVTWLPNPYIQRRRSGR
jgi:hypothetical protein